MKKLCNWKDCKNKADYYGILPHHNCGEFVCEFHKNKDWYQDLTPIDDYNPKDFGFQRAITINK